MEQFKFSVNGTEVDRPNGWSDLESSIVVKGGTSSSIIETNTLSFSGVTQELLLSSQDSNPCIDTITLVIEYRKSKWDTWIVIFNGFLELSKDSQHEIWTDDYKGKFTCKGVSNPPLNAILENKDKDISLSPFTSILGGRDIKGLEIPDVDIPKAQALLVEDSLLTHSNLFDVPSGSGLSYNTSRPPVGYTIKDIFQHHVRVLTSGDAEFISDFFTRDYRPTKYQIDITTNPANGETMIFVFEDSLGNQYTYKSVFDSALIQDSYNKLENVFRLVSNNDKPQYYYGECARADLLIIPPFYRYELTFFIDVTLSSYSVGSGVATVTKTQSYQDGGAHILFSDGRMIPRLDFYSTTSDPNLYFPFNESAALSINFQQFYKYVDEIFDIDMREERAGLITYIRIEPRDYWSNNSPTVTVNNISPTFIKRMVNNDTQFSYVNIGGLDEQTRLGRDEENVLGINIPNTNSCPTLDLLSSKEVYSLWGYKTVVQIEDGKFEDEYFFTSGVWDSVLGIYKIRPFRYDLYDYVSDEVKKVYYYNVDMCPRSLYGRKRKYLGENEINTHNVTKEHNGTNYAITETLTTSTYQEGSEYFKYKYDIDCYISIDQWKTIEDERALYINVSSDSNDKKYIRIESGKFNFVTKKAIIKGYGKE